MAKNPNEVFHFTARVKTVLIRYQWCFADITGGSVFGKIIPEYNLKNPSNPLDNVVFIDAKTVGEVFKRLLPGLEIKGLARLTMSKWGTPELKAVKVFYIP